MIYYDGGVSINCQNNVDFKSIVNNALNIPLTVRPNDVEINTTINPCLCYKKHCKWSGWNIKNK
jgi:hypothetical protein